MRPRSSAAPTLGSEEDRDRRFASRVLPNGTPVFFFFFFFFLKKTTTIQVRITNMIFFFFMSRYLRGAVFRSEEERIGERRDWLQLLELCERPGRRAAHGPVQGGVGAGERGDGRDQRRMANFAGLLLRFGDHSCALQHLYPLLVEDRRHLVFPLIENNNNEILNIHPTSRRREKVK